MHYELLLLAYGGFPSSLHALFIAERHESQHTKHSEALVRTRYNSVTQHVIAQSAVAIVGPPRAVAAWAWAEC